MRRVGSSETIVMPVARENSPRRSERRGIFSALTCSEMPFCGAGKNSEGALSFCEAGAGAGPRKQLESKARRTVRDAFKGNLMDWSPVDGPEWTRSREGSSRVNIPARLG